VPLQLACSTLPFETIKKHRPIDDDCDVAGNATPTNHQAQNRAKNNFCVAGTPALATVFTFQHLQSDVEAVLKPLKTAMPDDRTVLQNLHKTSEGDVVGEGSLVVTVGWLVRGKYSNVGSGESVNCDLTDKEENDIHLNLVRTKPPANPTDDQLKGLECKSVVAEISPHFRPEAWGGHGQPDQDVSQRDSGKENRGTRSPPPGAFYWTSLLRRFPPEALCKRQTARQLQTYLGVGDSPHICDRCVHQHIDKRLSRRSAEQMEAAPRMARTRAGWELEEPSASVDSALGWGGRNDRGYPLP
jgi:hypothetical protein